MSNFLASAVPADGVAPSGTMICAGTVMKKKFWSRIYAEPALEGLNRLFQSCRDAHGEVPLVDAATQLLDLPPEKLQSPTQHLLIVQDVEAYMKVSVWVDIWAWFLHKDHNSKYSLEISFTRIIWSL